MRFIDRSSEHSFGQSSRGAELAVYVQALQRRALAFRSQDFKWHLLVIRHTKRHKCGLKPVALKHQYELVGFIDVVFKAQPDEPTALALRGLAAILQEDSLDINQFMPFSGKINLIDLTVTQQRRVVRSASGAELNGFVDRI